MRIALFVTCLGDVLFPDVARATVTVLERLGHEVVFPPAQTCCGQMHTNTGYQHDALASCATTSTSSSGVPRCVRRAVGSCVGSVRHQHAAVARRAGDEALAVRAEAVAARTYELSQLLVDVLGVTDVGASYPHRVTYHPTCHSLRLLGVGDRPLRLLRAVRGHRPGRAARRGRVLRLRRHVRGEERRDLDRDARRQDVRGARRPAPRW